MLDVNLLIKFSLFLFPLFIVQYFINYQILLDSRISGKVDVVNNSAYSLTAIIPFLFLLIRHRTLIPFVFLVLEALILFSAKRGAILAGAFEFLGMIGFVFFNQGSKNWIAKSVFVLLLLGSVLFLSTNFIDFSDYTFARFSSLSDGNFSGRDLIYASLLNTWYTSESVSNIFFGYGFGSSMLYSGTGNFAHNDWIEMLFSFGIFGLLLYFLLMFSITKILYNVFKNNTHSIMAAVLFCVIITNSLNYRFLYAFESFLYILLIIFLEKTNRSINRA